MVGKKCLHAVALWLELALIRGRRQDAVLVPFAVIPGICFCRGQTASSCRGGEVKGAFPVSWGASVEGQAVDGTGRDGKPRVCIAEGPSCVRLGVNAETKAEG